MLTFRKIGYIAAITAAGVFGASAASAAVVTYNFETFSAVESGVDDGDTVDGLQFGAVTFAGAIDYSGAANSPLKEGNAYFDGGYPAGGLGVCSTGLTAADQCVVPSDDNIQLGEAVGINFGTGDLTQVTFNAEGHNDLPLGVSFLYSTDGAATFTEAFTGADGTWNTSQALVDGSGIWFGFGGTNADQFYLSSATFDGTPPDGNGGPSPVPLPAGGLLLLTALAGLGAARKRAKKS